MKSLLQNIRYVLSYLVVKLHTKQLEIEIREAEAEIKSIREYAAKHGIGLD